MIIHVDVWMNWLDFPRPRYFAEVVNSPNSKRKTFGMTRAVTRGQGVTIPRQPNYYRGAKTLRGALQGPNNVASTFVNTVHLLPKDLRFEHGGAKLVSCPGRHLTCVTPLHLAISNSSGTTGRLFDNQLHVNQ